MQSRKGNRQAKARVTVMAPGETLDEALARERRVEMTEAYRTATKRFAVGVPLVPIGTFSIAIGAFASNDLLMGVGSLAAAIGLTDIGRGMRAIKSLRRD